MKIAAILCHPEGLKGGSLNSSIYKKLNQNLQSHTLTLIDLYSDNFDPVLHSDEIIRKISFDDTVLKYQKIIEESDYIFFIYPEWWGSLPALLKGWIDRVLIPGFAYDYTGNVKEEMKHHPLLKGKRASVIITSNDEKISRIHEEFWENIISDQTGLSFTKIKSVTGLRTKSSDQILKCVESVCNISL